MKKSFLSTNSHFVGNQYSFALQTVFDNIENYCPGFKSSVIGRDILPPPELERIFGLTGGVSVPCLDSFRAYTEYIGSSSLCNMLSAVPYLDSKTVRMDISGSSLCNVLSAVPYLDSKRVRVDISGSSLCIML